MSADGGRVVAGTDDGHLMLWNIDAGTTTTLLDDGDAVESVAMSADGTRAASGGQDRLVHVWNTDSGEYMHELMGHTQRVNAVAMSADGTRVASGSSDRTVRVWDGVAGGGALFTLEGHTGSVRAVAMSIDGTRVASAGYDGTVRVWDATSGFIISEMRHKYVRSVDISADKNTVVSGDENGDVQVWNLANGTAYRFAAHDRDITSIALPSDMDMRRLITGSLDRTVRVWDISDSRRPRLRKIINHVHEVTDIAMDGVGGLLAAVGEGPYLLNNTSVSLVDVNAHIIWDPRPQSVGRHALGVSANGVWTVEVNRLEEKEKSKQRFQIHTRKNGVPNTSKVFGFGGGGGGGGADPLRVSHAAVSDNGDRVVLGANDNVYVFEISSQIMIPINNGGFVRAVAISADGARVASGSNDRAVRVWNIVEGGAPITLLGHAQRITAVALSADGGRVASGSYDTSVRVWDGVAGGDALVTLRGHTGTVWAVALSAHGARVVSGSEDRTVRVWNGEVGGAALLTLEGHEDEVLSVALSTDNIVVSGSKDHTVRVWDGVKGGPSIMLYGHHGGVKTVAISHNAVFSSTEIDGLYAWDLFKDFGSPEEHNEPSGGGGGDEGGKATLKRRRDEGGDDDDDDDDDEGEAPSPKRNRPNRYGGVRPTDARG